MSEQKETSPIPLLQISIHAVFFSLQCELHGNWKVLDFDMPFMFRNDAQVPMVYICGREMKTRYKQPIEIERIQNKNQRETENNPLTDLPLLHCTPLHWWQ